MGRTTVNLSEETVKNLKDRMMGYGNTKKTVEDIGLTVETLYRAVKLGRVSPQSKVKIDKFLELVAPESEVVS